MTDVAPGCGLAVHRLAVHRLAGVRLAGVGAGPRREHQRALGTQRPLRRNCIGAEEELGPARMQLMLGHTDYVLEREEPLVRTALSWSPAAVVLVGLEHDVFEIWNYRRSP